VPDGWRGVLESLNQRPHGTRIAEFSEGMRGGAANRETLVTKRLDERWDGPRISPSGQRLFGNTLKSIATAHHLKQRLHGAGIAELSQRLDSICGERMVRITQGRKQRTWGTRVSALAKTHHVSAITPDERLPVLLTERGQRVHGGDTDLRDAVPQRLNERRDGTLVCQFRKGLCDGGQSRKPKGTIVDFFAAKLDESLHKRLDGARVAQVPERLGGGLDRRMMLQVGALQHRDERLDGTRIPALAKAPEILVIPLDPRRPSPFPQLRQRGGRGAADCPVPVRQALHKRLDGTAVSKLCERVGNDRKGPSIVIRRSAAAESEQRVQERLDGVQLTELLQSFRGSVAESRIIVEQGLDERFDGSLVAQVSQSRDHVERGHAGFSPLFAAQLFDQRLNGTRITKPPQGFDGSMANAIVVVTQQLKKRFDGSPVAQLSQRLSRILLNLGFRLEYVNQRLHGAPVTLMAK
jgi:hypothetical protein